MGNHLTLLRKIASKLQTFTFKEDQKNTFNQFEADKIENYNEGADVRYFLNESHNIAVILP